MSGVRQEKIEIAAVSEHRWEGKGEARHGEHLFLFSEPDETWGGHCHGVAMVIGGSMGWPLS